MDASGFNFDAFDPTGEVDVEEAIEPNASSLSVPQNIHSAVHRTDFDPQQHVYLQQFCFTPSQVFAPGMYQVSHLPDEAFQMGLIAQSPVATPLSTETKTVIKDDQVDLNNGLDNETRS